MLYDAVFAVGCVIALTGGVALFSGWVPPWLTYVSRPRLFGLWCLSMGIFCMAQLPAIGDRVRGVGSVGIDAILLLVVIGIVALLLSVRRNRAR